MRWPGLGPGGTLVLPLREADARVVRAAHVVLDGVRFEAKPELHVTLVGRALGARLAMSIAAGRFTEADVAQRFEALDWTHAPTDAWVWLRKAKDDGVVAESVIELIDMPAMPVFHFALARLLGDVLAPPPPHVTHFVRGDPEGIGVPDEATLRAATVRLVARDELERQGGGGDPGGDRG